MTDYISREMTINAICRLCNANFEEDPCEPSECEMMSLLRKIPAADVWPVVRGKWKVSVHKTYYDVSCSVCGINSFFQVDEKDSISYANFCPNCGADMRERENEKA